MMDFVIEYVKEQIVNAPRVLSKGSHCLLEACRWNLPPKHIDFLSAFVPKPENLLLWTRIAVDRLIPISSDDSPDHRFGHADHLEGQSSKRPHRTNGKAEEAILGERLDHATSQTAMPLPMLQESGRGNHQNRRFNWCRHHISCVSLF